jgi:ferredoxin, 2Fe-2S
MERTVEVAPSALPYGHHGLPGSVLDVALHHGIAIDHACGGFGACATCHVIIESGYESCGEPTEDEEDQLDEAVGLTPRSRLACLCVPDGKADLVVRVPTWNRNLVSESDGHS